MVDLNRQYGQDQPKPQKLASRAATERLFGNNQPLRRGELSDIVRTGGPPEQAAPHMFSKNLCLDCGVEVVNPLRSQPRRCRPCGKAKRQAHNQAHKQRVDELVSGVETPKPPAEPEQQEKRSIWDPE